MEDHSVTVPKSAFCLMPLLSTNGALTGNKVPRSMQEKKKKKNHGLIPYSLPFKYIFNQEQNRMMELSPCGGYIIVLLPERPLSLQRI